MKKENTVSKPRKTVAKKAPAAKPGRKPRAAKAAATPAETTGKTKSITFSIAAAAGLPVFVAGTFNNWDPESIPLVEKDGVYTAVVELAPGEYEYKFIVNGFWTMDPDSAREWRPNGLGTLNSVLVVR